VLLWVESCWLVGGLGRIMCGEVQETGTAAAPATTQLHPHTNLNPKPPPPSPPILGVNCISFGVASFSRSRCCLAASSSACRRLVLGFLGSHQEHALRSRCTAISTSPLKPLPNDGPPTNPPKPTHPTNQAQRRHAHAAALPPSPPS